MTVKLAMYKGKGTIANKIIRWWTNSPYSHCELVVDGLWYSSSVMDGGVRSKEIVDHSNHWDYFEIPWGSKDAIMEYFRLTDHHRYGWLSLIWSQLFNRNMNTSTAQFCSEWCANALAIPNAASHSPASLARLCEWLNQA